jgi:CheY-like chemotaxis protein
VGNATKFTEKGDVAVRVNLVSEDGRGVVLRFEVADTGIGIAREKQASIFAPFVQADGSSTRRYGGTGLGLAISSNLVELMGGEISLDSEPGTGSRFRFTTRLKRGAGVALLGNRINTEELSGVPVLVVDDNATNRLILRETLTKWRMNPVLVDNGLSALEALHTAGEQGRPFRLILVDLQMPGMDGFELIQKVREDLSLDSAAIMMLSSVGWQVNLARCEGLQMSAYLTKPVTQSDLFNSILKVLRPNRQVSAATARGPAASGDAAPPQNGKILVVEDNENNSILVSHILTKHGYAAVTAKDGLEALAWVRKESFDLILMDVQMPNLGGLETTAEIRRMEQSSNRRTPIIALTAHVLKGDRERCLDLGMDDYVTKPIRSAELLAKIAVHISPSLNLSTSNGQDSRG